MSPSSRRRVLALDYGGVLTNPIGDSFKSLVDRTSIPPSAVDDALRKSAANGDATVMAALERGEMTIDDAFARILKHLPLDATVPSDELSRLWLAGRVPNHEMKDAVTGLTRGYDVVTILATNNVREWEPHWRGVIDGLTFDQEVVSCEIGARKPEPEFYRHLIRVAQVPPGDILFFDDVQQNVDAARAFGIDARLYTSSEDFERQARQWLDARDAAVDHG